MNKIMAFANKRQTENFNESLFKPKLESEEICYCACLFCGVITVFIVCVCVLVCPPSPGGVWLHSTTDAVASNQNHQTHPSYLPALQRHALQVHSHLFPFQFCT